MSRQTILWVTMSVTGARSLDRSALLDRFSRARARTRALFDLLEDGAYYERPIPLRNPVVFYEGHVPAFSVNTLIKKGLGRAGVDEHLERVFARGIDPETEATAVARGNPAWPGRDEVRGYVEAADRLVADAIRNAEIERMGIRCYRTGRRFGRSSSTRRCTRRRSPTCGTSCRTGSSGSHRTT